MPNDTFTPEMTSAAPPSSATGYTEILPDAGQAATQPSGAAPALRYLYGDTRRINWGARMGKQVLTLYWPNLTAGSLVFVSVSEADAYGNRFIGAARYTVHNVAPRANYVDIWVNIEWGAPIILVADYLLVRP